MAGRPSTPIELHKMRGTYVESRHGGKLAVPDEVIGDPPTWFNEVMRVEWNRLGALKHIKAAHRVAVEHACLLYSRFVEDAQSTRPMTASERATFHSVYMQLACTPASEAKVPAQQPKAPDSPWSKFG